MGQHQDLWLGELAYRNTSGVVLLLEGKRILIGVSGGIAAYKICEVVSALAKAGASVRVILTEQAQAFVTPLSFATLSRHAAYTDRDFWSLSSPGVDASAPSHPLHIELGEWAEIFVIAPLTANTLAKLAHGLADNLLTNTVLASTCPLLLAPAMNTDMWQQQIVQYNWRLVLSDPRYHTLNPSQGVLACDRVGTGRMAEPEEIVAQIRSLLYTHGKRDLAGKHILISTGGTREHFDLVRFIGNPSTGKMGVALALAAAHRGAIVTLVHAPMEASLLALLQNVQLIPIVNAAEMQQAMLHHFPVADWIVMAAAVADVRSVEIAAEKLPKRSLPTSLPLALVSDIVTELGQRKQPTQRLIGFAAQTGDIVPPAIEKLHQKQLDAIVANPIDLPDSGFGSDQNQAVFIDKAGRQQTLDPCSKLEMAHQLFDFVQEIQE